MGLIDSILNIVCLLLWISWRSLQLARASASSPLSLVSTLKKTGPSRGARWLSLAAIPLLLGLRSLFYWNLGPALNWTPALELGVVSLPFRTDYYWRSLLFSILSFVLASGWFYSWLILLSVINRNVSNEEPLHRLVRLHLGWVEGCPVTAKLLLPLALAMLLWGFCSPSLVRLGMLPPPSSALHLWEQAFLIGLATVLVWKVLVLVLCLLYLINNYVYLGKSYFWSYVNTTGLNLLAPLRRLPMRIGKVDLSPFFAIAIVAAAARWAGLWLPKLFQRLPI